MQIAIQYDSVGLFSRSLSPAYKILLFKFFNNSGDQIQKSENIQ